MKNRKVLNAVVESQKHYSEVHANLFSHCRVEDKDAMSNLCSPLINGTLNSVSVH